MRVTEKAEGSGVLVQEMTVSEVREWNARVAAAPVPGDGDAPKVDVVGALLFEIPLEDLKEFVVGDVDFGKLSQSEVRELIAIAKRLNPDFFSYRGKLLEAPAAPVTGQQAP